MVPSPQRTPMAQAASGPIPSPCLRASPGKILPLPSPASSRLPSPALAATQGTESRDRSCAPVDLFSPSDFRPDGAFASTARPNGFARHRAALAPRSSLSTAVTPAEPGPGVRALPDPRRIVVPSPSLVSPGPLSPKRPSTSKALGSHRSASLSVGSLWSGLSHPPSSPMSAAERKSEDEKQVSGPPPDSANSCSPSLGRQQSEPAGESESLAGNASVGLGLLLDGRHAHARSSTVAGDLVFDRCASPSAKSMNTTNSSSLAPVLPYEYVEDMSDSKCSLDKFSLEGTPSLQLSLPHEGSLDTLFQHYYDEMQAPPVSETRHPALGSFNSIAPAGSTTSETCTANHREPPNLHEEDIRSLNPSDQQPGSSDSFEAKRTQKLARLLGNESMSDVLSSQVGLEERKKRQGAIRDATGSYRTDVPEVKERDHTRLDLPLSAPPSSWRSTGARPISAPPASSPLYEDGLGLLSPVPGIRSGRSTYHTGADGARASALRRPVTSGTLLNPVAEGDSEQGVKPKAAALLGIDPNSQHLPSDLALAAAAAEMQVQPKAAALLGIDRPSTSVSGTLPSLSAIGAPDGLVHGRESSPSRRSPVPRSLMPGANGERPSFWPRWHVHLSRPSSFTGPSTRSSSSPLPLSHQARPGPQAPRTCTGTPPPGMTGPASAADPNVKKRALHSAQHPSHRSTQTISTGIDSPSAHTIRTSRAHTRSSSSWARYSLWSLRPDAHGVGAGAGSSSSPDLNRNLAQLDRSSSSLSHSPSIGSGSCYATDSGATTPKWFRRQSDPTIALLGAAGNRGNVGFSAGLTAERRAQQLAKVAKVLGSPVPDLVPGTSVPSVPDLTTSGPMPRHALDQRRAGQHPHPRPHSHQNPKVAVPYV